MTNRHIRSHKSIAETEISTEIQFAPLHFPELLKLGRAMPLVSAHEMKTNCFAVKIPCMVLPSLSVSMATEGVL